MRYTVRSSMILIILVFSCGDGYRTIKEYNDDGKLSRKFHVDQDSIVQGTLLSYYDNGQDIFEKASYVDGQLEGKRILYFENGQPEIIEHYTSDILSDTLYLFYLSGALKMTSYYKNGIHTGINTVYYESGSIKEEVRFHNNEEQGPFIEYHPNGQVHWTGQYLNGENEYGELIQYDSTGQMIKKMMCDSLAICKTVWPEA